MSKSKQTVVAMMALNAFCSLLAVCVYFSPGFFSLPIANEGKTKKLISKLETQPVERVKSVSIDVLKHMDAYCKTWIDVAREGTEMYFVLCLANIGLCIVALIAKEQKNSDRRVSGGTENKL